MANDTISLTQLQNALLAIANNGVKAADTMNTSLFGYARKAIICSRVFIEDTIAGEDVMPDLMKNIMNLYTGLIVTSMNMSQNIVGSRTMRDYMSVVATEAYQEALYGSDLVGDFLLGSDKHARSVMSTSIKNAILGMEAVTPPPRGVTPKSAPVASNPSNPAGNTTPTHTVLATTQRSRDYETFIRDYTNAIRNNDQNATRRALETFTRARSSAQDAKEKNAQYNAILNRKIAETNARLRQMNRPLTPAEQAAELEKARAAADEEFIANYVTPMLSNMPLQPEHKPLMDRLADAIQNNDVRAQSQILREINTRANNQEMMNLAQSAYNNALKNGATKEQAEQAMFAALREYAEKKDLDAAAKREAERKRREEEEKAKRLQERRDDLADKNGTAVKTANINRDYDIDLSKINLPSGRLIDIDIATAQGNKLKVNMLLQLHNQFINSTVADAFITLNFVPTSEQRKLMMSAGEISFWKDFVFGCDLRAKRTKALLADKTGALREMLAQQSQAKDKLFQKVADSYGMGVTGTGNRQNIANSILILNKETFDRACSSVGQKFDTFQQRQRFFDKTFAMMLVIVDAMFGRVTMYFNSIESFSTFTVNQIKHNSKTEATDLLAIMNSYAKGMAPKF